MRDNKLVKVFQWNVLHLLLTIAGTQGVFLLTSDKQYAQLQGDITLTCNTSDSDVSVEFNKDNKYVGRCIFSCETLNATKFSVNKVNKTEHVGYSIFTLTVKNFEVNDEGSYTCATKEQSQVSNIQITYAGNFRFNITSVTLTPRTDPISVIENVTQRFRCETSRCRPDALITWFLGSTQLTAAIESSTSQEVTTSTIDHTPQKNQHDMNIFCRGDNGGQLQTSEQPRLNVLYGPNEPVCKLGGLPLSSAVTVKEGWEFRLDCSSDGNPSPSFSWTHPGDGPSYPLFIRSINRTHAGIFRIIARSNLIPSEQKAVNLTKDIYVKVEVQYPPDLPSCRVGSTAVSSNIISAIRGNTITITCSCDSNPSSTYSWSLTGVSTTTSGQSLDLLVQKATTITLTMKNSMQFTNKSTEQGRRQSPINVQVLFPPRTPIFHLGRMTGAIITDNTLNVIRGKVTTVICESSANPPPTYTWNGNNHTMTFTPTVDETMSCCVRNKMVTTGYGTVSGNNSSVLKVNVLYPPGTPDLSFPSCLGEPITVNTSIKVIQGQPVNVTCSASSRPAPTYSWSRHQSKQSNVMWIPNAQTSHQGTYTCKAENIMDFTFGGPIGTNSSKHFHLEVLMPPMVNPLTNVVVLERGNVSVVCQVTDGVPNKTEFKWEKMSDMTPISMEQTLSIDNIDRKQGGNYTCTASNLMRPTGCNATVGNSSNTVNIDVQYEAEVTNFTVSNFNHGQNIEVDENTQVIFYCQVQSNPLSNISMLKETQDLKTASHTNDLEFTISKSVCEDEGTYHCTTQYAHNTEADIRSLTLFVRCAPRASSLASRNQSITRSTGVPAVFTLKLVAFPRPRVADIIWEKNVSDRNTWVIVRNDTDIDILISEDGLQTQLSFSSVKEDDFGYYRVHVNNELGNYTESFRLQAQEHPHSPSSLQHFQKATVDTIHIEWTPGFDGGLPQTFYIEYREVGASVWREERGIAGQINYTIVGLNPATMYEIRVYSTNDIGRSNASEAITASTLKTPESGRPPVVLISVLVIVVCVVFAVVVIIVVIKKRLKGKNTADMDRLTMHHNLQSLGNPNTDGTDDDEDDEVINPIYDGGNTIQDEMNKTEALYSQPQKKKAVSVASGVGDTYAVVNKKPKGKPGTKHPSKPKKKSTNTEDVYENVGYQRGATGSTTSHGIDTYENHDVPLARKAAKRNVNADGLIYADLEFPNLPKGQQRFVIHGSDNMTDYATVDLTKKAEPLPESDDDESKSPSK
ncbi:hemicentin-1-like isoform X4 [Mya arenaria]|uniref:hemicentin-1-like isoform X4 n=1 Tax=Mya arenaria TaxID=6604 RepID=UPI0022E62C23|nr:hemicentin-1-like isoform X4 [Mya arenaria]